MFTTWIRLLIESALFFRLSKNMGKKDKHTLGKSRNNSVFKVANGHLGKQKGKPQEVKTKLNKISKEATRKAIHDSDNQLKLLQSKSVSVIGKVKNTESKKIAPANMLQNDNKANVDSLVEMVESSINTGK